MQREEAQKKLDALSLVYEKKFGGGNPLDWIVEADPFYLPEPWLQHMQEAIDKNDPALLETEEGSPL